MLDTPDSTGHFSSYLNFSSNDQIISRQLNLLCRTLYNYHWSSSIFLWKIMGTVDAQGSGLVFGTTGGKCRFMVYLQEFKEGEKIVEGLSVAIDGPSEPEIEFEHEENGDIEVTYRAFAPGQYIVTPRFNGQLIKDAPFKVKIVGEVNTHGQYQAPKKQITTGWAARRKSQAAQGSSN